VRGRSRHPTTVGDAVLVGPHAHVNGATLEPEGFGATGASVFPGAGGGAGAELRINCVVHVNTRVAAGAVVPIGWVAVGDPAQLFSPDRPEELGAVRRGLDFPATVCGVGGGPSMRTVMARQSEFYGAHRDDRVIG